MSTTFLSYFFLSTTVLCTWFLSTNFFSGLKRKHCTLSSITMSPHWITHYMLGGSVNNPLLPCSSWDFTPPNLEGNVSCPLIHKCFCSLFFLKCSIPKECRTKAKSKSGLKAGNSKYGTARSLKCDGLRFPLPLVKYCITLYPGFMLLFYRTDL